MKIFNGVVGVMVKKGYATYDEATFKEGQMYKMYDTNKDHTFVDENYVSGTDLIFKDKKQQESILSLKEVKEYCKNYVKEGVKGTFCAISCFDAKKDLGIEIEKPMEMSDMVSNLEQNYLPMEYFDGVDMFSKKHLIYFAYKNKDGKIIEHLPSKSVHKEKDELMR